MQVKAQLAQNQMNSRNLENQWPGNVGGQAPINPFCATNNYMNPISPQSSLESIDHSISDGMCSMQDIQSRSEDFSLIEACSKRRSYNNEMGELQELALRMMRN